MNCTFTHDEQQVIGLDDGQGSGGAGGAVVWDSHTTEVLQRLTGHANIVRWVAASPCSPALLTCRYAFTINKLLTLVRFIHLTL